MKLNGKWSAWRIALVVAIVAALLAALSGARATLDGGETTEPGSVVSEPAASSDSPATGPEGSSEDLSGSSSGGGGGVNNEVVVQNLVDGRFAHRAGFGMARVTGGDVTNTNSAAAVSSCSDCRTVAVAVQAVLVMGDSDLIVPRNQAVAINSQCLRCHSYALAYQYVVSTGGMVRFTPEGSQRLAELRAQISSLAAGDLPFLELEARIDALVEQMWAVVDQQVVRVGRQPKGSATKTSDRADDGAAPSPEESSAAPSPEPTEPDASGGSDGADTATPSPTPSSSSTPEPSPTPTPTSSGDPPDGA
jgi:hypothetical protein